MQKSVPQAGEASLGHTPGTPDAAVGGVYREEEIQAAGVFSERKAKISVTKSSDTKDRAQPGAQMNHSGLRTR